MLCVRPLLTEPKTPYHELLVSPRIPDKSRSYHRISSHLKYIKSRSPPIYPAAMQIFVQLMQLLYPRVAFAGPDIQTLLMLVTLSLPLARSRIRSSLTRHRISNFLRGCRRPVRLCQVRVLTSTMMAGIVMIVRHVLAGVGIRAVRCRLMRGRVRRLRRCIRRVPRAVTRWSSLSSSD